MIAPHLVWAFMVLRCYGSEDRCVNAICMQLCWAVGANRARRVCTTMARALSTPRQRTDSICWPLRERIIVITSAPS